MRKLLVPGACILILGLMLYAGSCTGLIKTSYHAEYNAVFNARTPEGLGYTYQGTTYWAAGHINFEAQPSDWITITCITEENLNAMMFIKSGSTYIYASPLEPLTSLTVGTTQLPAANPPTYTLIIATTSNAGIYHITVTVSGARTNMIITYTGIILAVAGAIILIASQKRSKT